MGEKTFEGAQRGWFDSHNQNKMIDVRQLCKIVQSRNRTPLQENNEAKKMLGITTPSSFGDWS